MNILEEESCRRLLVRMGLYAFLGTAALAFLRRTPLCLLVPVLCMAAAAADVCLYIRKQNALMEEAAEKIRAYLNGNQDERIACDREGQIYRLFHEINSLASVLNAHAQNELEMKDFMKNTMQDISHQLKTPLAALNIYNGILQDESTAPEDVKKFTRLSEQELDRIELLVQNLLKIAKLDAGTILFEKKKENLKEIFSRIEEHFAFRAEQEGKTISLEGDEDICIRCDRVWMTEALDNLVKNALDHTKAGDRVDIRWERSSDMVQISVRDTGSGIHPGDIYHIFKRFYRSRFSSDTQGIGLGLPLAKAITEAHGGTVEVDSEPGKGTVFCLYLPALTEL